MRGREREREREKEGGQRERERERERVRERERERERERGRERESEGCRWSVIESLRIQFTINIIAKSRNSILLKNLFTFLLSVAYMSKKPDCLKVCPNMT